MMFLMGDSDFRECGCFMVSLVCRALCGGSTRSDSKLWFHVKAKAS